MTTRVKLVSGLGLLLVFAGCTVAYLGLSSTGSKDNTTSDTTIVKNTNSTLSLPKQRVTVLNARKSLVPQPQDGDDLASRVDRVVEPFLEEIRAKEIASSKLLARYREGENEVVAVEFQGITEGELIELHSRLFNSLQSNFDNSKISEAQAIAAKKIESFASPDYPYQGITVICPDDPAKPARFSLAQNATGPPLHLEDGRVIESVNRGRLRAIPQSLTERYSHIVKIEQ